MQHAKLMIHPINVQNFGERTRKCTILFDMEGISPSPLAMTELAGLVVAETATQIVTPRMPQLRATVAQVAFDLDSWSSTLT